MKSVISPRLGLPINLFIVSAFLLFNMALVVNKPIFVLVFVVIMACLIRLNTVPMMKNHNQIFFYSCIPLHMPVIISITC